jgi:hypothetical protein
MGKNASHVFGSIRNVSDTHVDIVLSSGVYLRFEIYSYHEPTRNNLRLTRKWKYGMVYGEEIAVRAQDMRHARDAAVQKIAQSRYAKRIPKTPRYEHLWGKPHQLSLAFA